MNRIAFPLDVDDFIAFKGKIFLISYINTCADNAIFMQKFYTLSVYPVRLPLIYKDKKVLDKAVNFVKRESTAHGEKSI
jgi:hypothetical protein